MEEQVIPEHPLLQDEKDPEEEHRDLHVQNELESVTYFGKGEGASALMPGDFILTRGKSWQSWFIRFGQSFRFRKESGKYAHWNHAALIIDAEGALIEALAGGVAQTNISKYKNEEYLVVRVKANHEDRMQAVNYAGHALGLRYGFIEALSLGFSLITGLKYVFTSSEELICSGLVAAALERTWAVFDRPCNHMAPADLAEHYQVEVPSAHHANTPSLQDNG